MSDSKDSRAPPAWPATLPWKKWREQVMVWEMSQGDKNVSGRAATIARSFVGERRIRAERWCLDNMEKATKGEDGKSGALHLVDFLGEDLPDADNDFLGYQSVNTFWRMKRASGERMDAYLDRVSNQLATMKEHGVEVSESHLAAFLLDGERSRLSASDVRSVLQTVLDRKGTEVMKELRRLFHQSGLSSEGKQANWSEEWEQWYDEGAYEYWSDEGESEQHAAYFVDESDEPYVGLYSEDGQGVSMDDVLQFAESTGYMAKRNWKAKGGKSKSKGGKAKGGKGKGKSFGGGKGGKGKGSTSQGWKMPPWAPQSKPSPKGKGKGKQTQQVQAGQCLNCFEYGHWARDCPKPRRGYAAEREKEGAVASKVCKDALSAERVFSGQCD